MLNVRGTLLHKWNVSSCKATHVDTLTQTFVWGGRLIVYPPWALCKIKNSLTFPTISRGCLHAFDISFSSFSQHLMLQKDNSNPVLVQGKLIVTPKHITMKQSDTQSAQLGTHIKGKEKTGWWQVWFIPDFPSTLSSLWGRGGNRWEKWIFNRATLFSVNILISAAVHM